MIENIARHTEEGEDPLTAALKGAREIGFTVISLTVSLIAVFIPLLFMTGLVGRMFREFALTLSIAVVVSAVISLTLTPMLCASLLSKKTGPTETRLQHLFDWPMRIMASLYEATLDWALLRPRLGRMIVQNLLDEKETLSVMTLDPGLEQLLHNVLQQQSQNQNVVMEPGLAERLFGALRQGAKDVEDLGHAAGLVVSPAIRPWLAKAVRHRVSELVVLSYAEIPDDQSIQVIHTVSAENQQA
jgi:hypothetical protein